MKALLAILALLVVLGLGFLLYSSPTGPTEMSEAEIAQIQTEVTGVMERSFEGWRQGDTDMILSAFHPTETSFSWGTSPWDFATVSEWVRNWYDTRESWEGGFTETSVKVFNQNEALFQGVYQMTITRRDGRVLHYPGTASWVSLMERTEEGWKVTIGLTAAGSYEVVEEG